MGAARSSAFDSKPRTRAAAPLAQRSSPSGAARSRGPPMRRAQPRAAGPRSTAPRRGDGLRGQKRPGPPRGRPQPAPRRNAAGDGLDTAAPRRGGGLGGPSGRTPGYRWSAEPSPATGSFVRMSAGTSATVNGRGLSSSGGQGVSASSASRIGPESPRDALTRIAGPSSSRMMAERSAARRLRKTLAEALSTKCCHAARFAFVAMPRSLKSRSCPSEDPPPLAELVHVRGHYDRPRSELQCCPEGASGSERSLGTGVAQLEVPKFVRMSQVWGRSSTPAPGSSPSTTRRTA